MFGDDNNDSNQLSGDACEQYKAFTKLRDVLPKLCQTVKDDIKSGKAPPRDEAAKKQKEDHDVSMGSEPPANTVTKPNPIPKGSEQGGNVLRRNVASA